MKRYGKDDVIEELGITVSDLGSWLGVEISRGVPLENIKVEDSFNGRRFENYRPCSKVFLLNLEYTPSGSSVEGLPNSLIAKVYYERKLHSRVEEAVLKYANTVLRHEKGDKVSRTVPLFYGKRENKSGHLILFTDNPTMLSLEMLVERINKQGNVGPIVHQMLDEPVMNNVRNVVPLIHVKGGSLREKLNLEEIDLSSPGISPTAEEYADKFVGYVDSTLKALKNSLEGISPKDREKVKEKATILTPYLTGEKPHPNFRTVVHGDLCPHQNFLVSSVDLGNVREASFVLDLAYSYGTLSDFVDSQFIEGKMIPGYVYSQNTLREELGLDMFNPNIKDVFAATYIASMYANMRKTGLVAGDIGVRRRMNEALPIMEKHLVNISKICGIMHENNYFRMPKGEKAALVYLTDLLEITRPETKELGWGREVKFKALGVEFRVGLWKTQEEEEKECEDGGDNGNYINQPGKKSNIMRGPT